MRPPVSGGIACTDSYRFLPHNIPGAWRREGRHAIVPRSIVSPLHAVLPLQGGDLGAITGGAQIGTCGVHEVEPWEALIGRGGAKQRTPQHGQAPFCTTQRRGRHGVHARQESTAHTAIMSNSPTRGQRQTWRTIKARIASVFSRSITVSACSTVPAPPRVADGVPCRRPRGAA